MPVSAKDWSEIVKNGVSAAAIVVGGLWVLFQWDVMFPKTRADVQTAAASVRTDVSGAFTVQLGLGEEGLPFRGAPGADEALGIGDYCAANPGATLLQTSSVFGQLKLTSASAIPVRARVERVRIATAAISPGAIGPNPAPRGAVRATRPTNVAAVADDAMFFGGLRENRVEKGQDVQVAVMFDADIPVRCDQLERLALFQAEVALTGIDPRRDEPVGKPVSKVFVTACQLNPRTAPSCNVQDVQAYGQ